MRRNTLTPRFLASILFPLAALVISEVHFPQMSYLTRSPAANACDIIDVTDVIRLNYPHCGGTSLHLAFKKSV